MGIDRVKTRKAAPAASAAPSAPAEPPPKEVRWVEATAACGHVVRVKLKPASGPERLTKAAAQPCGPCRHAAHVAAQRAVAETEARRTSASYQLPDGAVITLVKVGKRLWRGRLEAGGETIEIEGNGARSRVRVLTKEWVKRHGVREEDESATPEPPTP